MAISKLSASSSLTIPAQGLLNIEAGSLGQAKGGVKIELEGDYRANRGGSSASLKVLGGAGRVSICLRPKSGSEFKAGTDVQLLVSRGRPGTPTAEGAEFPRINLDGRSEAMVGTLTFGPDTIVIAAEGMSNERSMSGLAADTRTGLRTLLNRQGITAQPVPAGEVALVVDDSASLSAQTSETQIAEAAEVLFGIIATLYQDTDIRLDGTTFNNASDLASALQDAARRGRSHIGSGVERPEGTADAPTFAVSDEAPVRPRGVGLTLVVGNGASAAPEGTNGVLALTPEFLEGVRAHREKGTDVAFNTILSSTVTAKEA